MSEALYYPYTTIRSNDALKAMVLYFDKIHIISPFETAIGDKRVDSADIISLEQAGEIKLISPSDLLSEYDSIMTKSVINDLLDPEFLSLSHQQQNRTPWKIYAEKVPSGLADATLRKFLVNIPSFYAGQSAAGCLREGPIEMPYRHRFYEERTETSERMDRQFREFRHVSLPFEVGESIMINHALCASYRFGLTPLTDERVHYDFLMLKFGRMAKNPLMRRILADYRFIKNVKMI